MLQINITEKGRQVYAWRLFKGESSLMEHYNIPSLVVLSFVGIIFCMALKLYLRWRNQSYYVFTISMGISFFLNILITLNVTLLNNSYFENRILLLEVPAYLLTLFGIFHIFIPKKQKHILIFNGAALLALFVVLSSIFIEIKFTVLILVALNLGFLAYFYFSLIPQLPKRNLYTLTIGFQALATILLILFITVGKPFLGVSMYVFTAVAYFFLFIILFDRILDLMQAVSYSSVMDGLTGLYNKNYFKKKVEEYVLNKNANALVFIDIDNFKKLNDTKGHHVGDVMLKFASALLKDTFERTGICGRYGGEEMVVLVTDPRSDTFALAEKFRSRLESLSMMGAAKGYVPITVSVGVCNFSEVITSEDEFISKADDAMYRSKQNGKNQVTDYDQIPFEEVASEDLEFIAPAEDPVINLKHIADQVVALEAIQDVTAVPDNPILELAKDKDDLDDKAAVDNLPNDESHPIIKKNPFKL